MNEIEKKHRAWERYRQAVDSSPTGLKEWSNALYGGPAAFMGDVTFTGQAVNPEDHEQRWRAYWCLSDKVESGEDEQ